MVRGGPIWLKADKVSGDVTLGGALLPGAALGVDDKLHYGLLLTLPVNENFALETMVSTPLKVDVNAGGGLLGNEFHAAQIDVMPLMLLGRYSTTWNWHGIRPFAGVGATYLYFDNAKTSGVFDSFGASLGLNNPRVEIDNQWRPVLELGLDYLLDENWLVNATWIYIEGETDIAIVYSNGMQLISDVSYAPQFFSLTLGYRF